MGKYTITKDKDNNSFALYKNGVLLAKFRRSEFREALSALGRGNKCIGSILKLFLKHYPPPCSVRIRSDFDRAVDKYGEQGFADYLRSKGFRVTKKLAIDDKEIINYLERYGYQVEGLLEGLLYSTSDNLVGNPMESDSLRLVRGS